MEKLNLITKHITEFTPEDTIYIRDKSNSQHPIFLCQFISYEKGMVTGKAISTDTNNAVYKYKIEEGYILKAKLKECGLYGKTVDDEWSSFHGFDSNGYALNPEELKKIPENKIHIDKHPSFGIVSISKRQSGDRVLFGSSIKHSNIIAIAISKASHRRSISHDWYSADEEIIEIEMSANQFAELITTLNRGEGTPCTIKHINRKRMEDPIFVSKQEVHQKEFEARMHNFGVDIQKSIKDTVTILKEKSTISKGDRELILKNIEHILQEIKSNIPFFTESFIEQMDKTVTEAKAEIEAFMDSKIRGAGLEALALKEGGNEFLKLD